jgi:hypothetical protein
MLAESRCVIDPGQPCHACSAPGPDTCPYLYLLGWSGRSPGPDTTGPETTGPETTGSDTTGPDTTGPAAIDGGARAADD